MIRKHCFSCALWALACLLTTSFSPARALTDSEQDAAIASLQGTVASQQTTINALLAKLQYVTASGHDLTLTGNLHVVSGSGHTYFAPNGLGNVIIGYNESRGSSGTDTRTGSHNLILGQQNNYSSYGGIIAGYNNVGSAGYASVVGGRNNTASGVFSCVSGGADNTASASYTTVGGGHAVTAAASYAFLPLDADITSINNQFATLNSTAAGQGSNITSLQTGLTAATAITNLFSLSNDSLRQDGKKQTELTLTGVNLHIINGLGATNGEPSDPYDVQYPVVNGLGNLIVGYNVTRANDPNIPHGKDTHTGSHNLIIGDEENYSSYGGIVAGDYNTISAPFASISGGDYNTAGGHAAAVSGGQYNTAGGYAAAVSGGAGNMASGNYAWVSGGEYNTGKGILSSVSGGDGNTAGGDTSSVSGGIYNIASGDYSSISGGDTNLASGGLSSVNGGANNSATGDYSSISGGYDVTLKTYEGWAAGSLHSP